MEKLSIGRHGTEIASSRWRDHHPTSNPFLIAIANLILQHLQARLAMPPRSIENNQVGWVCALPKELTAARAMLDEDYEDQRAIKS